MTRTSLASLALFAMAAVGCQNMDLPISVEPSTSDNTSSTSVATQGGTVIPGQYIVVMNDEVADGKVESVMGVLQSEFDFQPLLVFKSAFPGFAAKMSELEMLRLKLDPRVKYIEPDYRINWTGQNIVYNTSGTQSVPWGITRVGGARDGTGLVAWIVDTGIDLYNSDLNVDRVRSRNFVLDGRTTAQDGNGHGTHVAGIIGAKNNTIGTVGVAANATLIGVRVLDNNGSGTYSSIIGGLDYVATYGRAGEVANLSLGGPASTALDDAVRRIAYKGIRVAIAAGNSSSNSNYTSPARLNYTNVYTVSAMDQNGYFASFSNYGNPPIDVAAPGVSILSTRVGGGSVYMSGTSMAAPHVAGLLLFGSLRGNGYVRNDRDATPDPIAYR